ncbi:phospholipase D family protein [Stenoxybacter acetivorans]|uniref:phospholipase D family protein n=1 Tax=Stenoxybacter acetivorans TaxID=422441 RepID=UPI000ACC99DF|nr:phospholipase D family protein [Stenoxybacter acetivorans]
MIIRLYLPCRFNRAMPFSSLPNPTKSERIRPNTPSMLYRAHQILLDEHQDLSGVYLLDDAREAFAARVALIDAAEHSLDVQYYIWRNDTSGQLLLSELAAAARRGVRVRLLLDDNNTVGMDNILTVMNREANVHIRLFNPFKNRRWRALGYLTDFSRLNRRMHNKSLTADNQVSIVGGRNIGDEYFDIGSGTLFVDLDILAIGKVVDTISADFDRYWNSAAAVDFSSIVSPKFDLKQAAAPIFSRRHFNQIRAKSYAMTLSREDFLKKLLSGSLPYQWATVHLVSDSPNKATPSRSSPKLPRFSPLDFAQEWKQKREQKQADQEESIFQHLAHTLRRPLEAVLLVTPYFVPTAAGVAALCHLRQLGVEISVLTNSLSATDVPAVHSGYARYRKALLQGGIALYELKNQHLIKGRRDRGVVGSSSSSLHAKTFTVDNERLFVGSLNLDPRSASLNTEMGLVIELPVLTQNVDETIKKTLPEQTYQVQLNENQQLQWLSEDSSGEMIIQYKEPQTTWRRRLWVKILSYLPIERLL